MKICLLLALVGLAMGYALPSIVEDKNAVDPQVRKDILALSKKFDEMWNKNDAVALAALYTEDAVIVRNTGPLYGREAIEKYFKRLFQAWHISDHLGTVDQYSPHIIGTADNEVWSNGEWSETTQGQDGFPMQYTGYWSMISVREDDAWKCRFETWNMAGRFPHQ